MGLGNANVTFAICHSFSGLTDFFLLGYADLGFVDGFGGCFFTQSFDVAAFVFDIRYVYVDQFQTNLFEFSIDIFGNVVQEFIPV